MPKVEALVVGDPADETTDVGPLISPHERDRVLAWIEQARAAAARRSWPAVTLEGELLRPTVVEEPAADSHLACDEAFGPVCTLQAYDTLDEAIDARERDALRAPGRGVHGLARVGARRRRDELEFGGVTVNEAPTFRADQMPYGGVKDSGNTREGPAWAVREMTEERLVVVQL